MITETEQQDYTFTLLTVKLKHKENLQMAVTNRRYNIHMVPKVVDGVYLFNQRFTIREGRPRKQHIDLLVNLVHEKGNSYIAGAIVLNRYELHSSEDIIKVKLSNCFDENAYCELQVNHIARVQQTFTRKRGESVVIQNEHSFGEHLFEVKSSLCVSPSNYDTRDGGWLSGHKSTGSATQRSHIEDDPQVQLKKQLTRYKFQLQVQKGKVKELTKRIETLEEEKDEEKQSKLKLQYSQQEWICQKQSLQSTLRRIEREREQFKEIYMKEIECLKKLVLGLKEGKQEEEDVYLLSLNGEELTKVTSSSLKQSKEHRKQLNWKKKQVSFQDRQLCEAPLKKNKSQQGKQGSLLLQAVDPNDDVNLSFNPESK